MARRDGDFLILLDVGNVLSISDMVTLGEAARARGRATDSDSDDPADEGI